MGSSVMYQDGQKTTLDVTCIIQFKTCSRVLLAGCDSERKRKDLFMAQKKDSPKASKGFSHPDYDSKVLQCFLDKQLQLFPEKVASTPEEAADFLEMCFAVVVRSKREVRAYFEEAGTDIEGEDLFSAAEVFAVGDGRYLIVEG